MHEALQFRGSTAVALDVGLCLPVEDFAAGPLRKRSRGGKVFQTSMGERMMIPFNDVRDAMDSSVVPGNRETDSVGSVARRKTRAGIARISKIAERTEGGVVGRGRAVRDGAANACPGVAERQHGVARAEVRARGSIG